MIVFALAVLLACVQAITAGYYLVRAVADAETRQGNILFASISGLCALFLFTVAVLHYEPV